MAKLLILLTIGFFSPLLLAVDGNYWKPCKQLYALCAAAKCIPDPKYPSNQAICQCRVFDGVSIGKSNCESRAPKQVNTTTQTVVSTLSFVELLAGFQVMHCEAGNPWTDCMDAPCTVSPINPKQAICRCPIMQGTKFITLGGRCNTKTCANAYWSGATEEDMMANFTLMSKILNLTKKPKNSRCEIIQSDKTGESDE